MMLAIVMQQPTKQHGLKGNRTGDGWQPIGTSQAPFSATFNGNGYTISNLYIDRSSTDGDEIGLFGYTGSNSTLTAIGLINVDINAARSRCRCSLAGH